MAEAFAQLNVLSAKLHKEMAKHQSRRSMHIDAINAFEDAKGVVRRTMPSMAAACDDEIRDYVAADVWKRGVAAYDECNAAHKVREDLIHAIALARTKAFMLMGWYHGGLMSQEIAGKTVPDGELYRTFWRHARAMAKTAQSQFPQHRVLGFDAEFPSTQGWAKAMALKDGRKLTSLIARISPTGHLVRLAGVR